MSHSDSTSPQLQGSPSPNERHRCRSCPRLKTPGSCDNSKDSSVLPERRLFVGRELTKQYESLYCGTAVEVLDTLQATDAVRGEFVLLIEAPPATAQVLAPRDRKLLALIAAEVGPSKAAKLMAQVTDLKRSELYDLLQDDTGS